MAATELASMQRIETVGERRRADDAAFRARVVERGKLSRHAEVARAMDYMLKRWAAFCG